MKKLKNFFKKLPKRLKKGWKALQWELLDVRYTIAAIFLLGFIVGWVSHAWIF